MCLIDHASGGPRWEPGIRVNVVIQLRDEEGNVTMLQLKNLEVIRTE